jgi:hypothetical protein
MYDPHERQKGCGVLVLDSLCMGLYSAFRVALKGKLSMQIIDADGHVNDRPCMEEIAKYMPPGNRTQVFSGF